MLGANVEGAAIVAWLGTQDGYQAPVDLIEVELEIKRRRLRRGLSAVRAHGYIETAGFTSRSEIVRLTPHAIHLLGLEPKTEGAPA